MRIRGWSIDRFGLFQDSIIDELPDGLTVIYGPNEAGKSTLLAFLRGVLFGFSDSVYPSLGSGRRGGRIFLLANEGDFTVEREANGQGTLRIICPDGREGTADDLKRTLGGVDDALFHSVFAFSLQELQSFASLDMDEVRERIFSATVAGAGCSARTVIAALETQAAGLLGQCKGARINMLVDDLNQLRPRLDAARRAATGYDELRAVAERSRAEVTRLRGLLAQEADREKLSAVAPIWKQLEAARGALRELELTDKDAAETDRALTEAGGKLEAAHAILRTLREEQQRTTREHADRQSATGPVSVVEAVERLHDALVLHRDRLIRRPVAKARSERAEHALAAKLRSLGPGWDAAVVRAFDASRRGREEAWDWLRRIAAAADEERNLEQALSGANENRNAIDRIRQEVEADLPSAAPRETAVLNERRQAIARLHENLATILVAQAQGEACDRTARDRERAMQIVASEDYPAPPPWLRAVLWLVTAISGVIVATQVANANWLSAFGMTVVGLVTGGVAYGAGRLERWADDRERARQAVLRTLRSELQEARRVRDGHWQNAAALRQIVSDDASTLGLPRFPTIEALNEQERELTRQETARASWAAAQARLGEIHHLLERREEEIRILTVRLTDARARSAAVRKQWSAWRTGKGLPTEVTAERALDFFDEIQEAQAIMAERAAAEAELQDVERGIRNWEERARSALAEADGAVSGELTGDEWVDRLLVLRSRFQQQVQQQIALAALEQTIQARAERIRTAEDELRRCEIEHDQLLREAGVMNERELHRWQERLLRRRELQRIIEEYERELTKLIGDGADRQTLLERLSAGGTEDWDRDPSSAAAEVQKTRSLLQQAEQRYNEAQQACREVEQSPSVAALELEWSGLMAELTAAVHRWRVLAAAQGLVEESMLEFERTRQPSVLVEASKIFSIVSGGKYRHVVQDATGHALAVVDHAGHRKRVADELSHATVEQLYMSIRLGLAADFANRNTALPLVMDDVLANFDPDRARGMAAALAALARTHQIMFFTCHPATREVLVEVGNAKRVIEL